MERFENFISLHEEKLELKTKCFDAQCAVASF